MQIASSKLKPIVTSMIKTGRVFFQRDPHFLPDDILHLPYTSGSFPRRIISFSALSQEVIHLFIARFRTSIKTAFCGRKTGGDRAQSASPVKPTSRCRTSARRSLFAFTLQLHRRCPASIAGHLGFNPNLRLYCWVNCSTFCSAVVILTTHSVRYAKPLGYPRSFSDSLSWIVRHGFITLRVGDTRQYHQ